MVPAQDPSTEKIKTENSRSSKKITPTVLNSEQVPLQVI